MSNSGVKKLLIALMSLLVVASIVAVSFAVWDTKSQENKFNATGGSRITVTVSGDSGFNKKLVPDHVIPQVANGEAEPAFYIYSKFTPKMTADTEKGASLYWKLKTLKINGVEQVDTTKGILKSDSILDCWVATSLDTSKKILEKPADTIAPLDGKLTSENEYYFVVKFKVPWTKVYTSGEDTYTFYSKDSTYKKVNKSGTTTGTIASLIQSNSSLFYNDATLSDYQRAPYNDEFVNVDEFANFSGKAINSEIEIYADKKN